MKNFKSAQAAVSILTVATVIGLCAAPAQAAPITISVSGVYDTVPDLPGGNGASGLLGTAYSASYTVSTNGADAIVTQRGSSVDSSGTTIDSRGWMFVSPGPGSCDPFFNTCYGPENNTLTMVDPSVKTIMH